MIIVALLCSYLIGSVPTAYVFGRVLRGIDIRNYGSGNVGATNALRVLGKGPGALVLAIDTFKGIVAVLVLSAGFDIVPVWQKMLLGLAAVAGHNWTVFLQFRGGKGIATSLGVLMGLAIGVSALRPVLGGALLVWLLVFLLSGYVSVASISAALALPVFISISSLAQELFWLGILFAVFVVVRHKTNIIRLRQGSETRVRFFHKRNNSNIL